MLGTVFDLVLNHQGTLREELAHRAILRSAVQAALLRVREGTVQGKGFPDAEPGHRRVGNGLHLEVDTDILKGVSSQ